MKSTRIALSMAALLVAIAVIVVTIATSCASRLEPGGAYAPLPITDPVTGVTTGQVADMPFYTVDAGFAMAYATLDGVFKWERDNRMALWSVSPNIKHTLDQLRPRASAVVVEYVQARAAYKKLPVPANLTVMQQVLAKMQQLLSAANAVVPKAK